MAMHGTVRFVALHTGTERHRAEVLRLTGEYFEWMSAEIRTLCGLSIPEMVGTGLDEYVALTMETMCAAEPPDGVFFLVEADGEAAGMGGLRRLPDGAAEIVRVYTDPAHRGHGLGSRTVDRLVEEARRLGYDRVKLDTGRFMTSAHRIYAAAGFTLTEPYPGAEPPTVLHPYWLYMQRPL